MGKNFNNIGINKDLEKILRKEGIIEPTLIQELSIPKILDGKDVIGKAQTGTGKTLSFLLPIFQKIDTNKKYTQAIIITPTRELALQISEEANKLLKYKEISILAVYGGQDVFKQINKLNKGVDLIIGTPGRILDHIDRKTINLNKIETFVIDEADEIINMGFFRDLEIILNKTPRYRQTLLFSATIDSKLNKIAYKIMNSPEKIEAKEKDLLETQIEEIKIYTTDRNKYDDLKKYLDENNPFMGLIFCRTKRRVKELATKMAQDGYNIDEIHGDLSQAKRERALKNFRDLKTQYLISTDIASRGLDIEGVTHVFNYDEPEQDVSYTHRIGRTGRAGETGTAVSFIVRNK